VFFVRRGIGPTRTKTIATVCEQLSLLRARRAAAGDTKRILYYNAHTHIVMNQTRRTTPPIAAVGVL